MSANILYDRIYAGLKYALQGQKLPVVDDEVISGSAINFGYENRVQIARHSNGSAYRYTVLIHVHVNQNDPKIIAQRVEDVLYQLSATPTVYIGGTYHYHDGEVTGTEADEGGMTIIYEVTYNEVQT